MDYDQSEEKPVSHSSVDENLSAKVLDKGQRILSLDVLRGIAVLGGLLVAIWVFGGFSRNMQAKLWVHPSGGNYRLFSTIVLLFEGKMRALIALVFGAGVVLFLAHKNKINSLSAYEVFIRRQMWLIVFGLLNALLFLATDDILFHLGVLGILTFVFARLSARSLFIAALVTTVIFCGKNYWRYADDKKAYGKYLAVVAVEKKFKEDSIKQKSKDSIAGQKAVAVAMPVKDSAKQKKDTLTQRQKDDKQAWEGLVKGLKYDPKKDDGENKSMRSGSYGELWNHLLQQTQWKEAKWTYTTGIWDLASMIFLGMALFKFGFFTGNYPVKKYILIAVAGITAGLLLGWYKVYFSNATLLDYEKYISHRSMPFYLFFPFERFFLASGYAAMLMVLLNVKFLKGLWHAMASVGRMAFTNYLVQCIFLSIFFTGFGMTYFGKLDQLHLYYIVAEIWIVQTVFSIIWLRHFSYGPFEWLLRCLSYGKWLPIGKDTIEPSEMPDASVIPSSL
jgi:uncharacterized protein